MLDVFFPFFFVFRVIQVDEMVTELVRRNVESSYIKLVKEIVRVSKCISIWR